MPDDATTRLQTLVYAALLGDAHWEDFLDQLRLGLPNGKALLFFHDTRQGRGAFPLQAGMDPEGVAAYGAYYSAINPWMRNAASRPIGRAMPSERNVPRSELQRTEFYSDFLRVYGMGTGVGMTLRRDAGCNFLLSVNGADCPEAEVFELARRMEAVAPHLARAFDHYRRDEQAGGVLSSGSGIGDALRVGVVTLGPGREVHAANVAAARFLDTSGIVWTDALGCFRCVSPAVTEALEAALRDWHRRDPAPPARSILVPRDGRLPFRITVIAPLGTDADAFFRGPRCTVLLEDPERDLGGATDEFAALHGLTRSERRLLAGLVDGRTVEEIAAESAISPHTARTQLKRIFARTGARRQSDLIRAVYALANTVVDSR